MQIGNMKTVRVIGLLGILSLAGIIGCDVFRCPGHGFHHGGTADTTEPKVLSTDPADTALNVVSSQKINATFSEAMDPATIDTTTFTLTGPGANTVSGAVVFDAANNVATLTPDIVLVADATFTATITTGVKDLA